MRAPWKRRRRSREHDHEWHPIDLTGEHILLEDGGAYFRYQCDWAPVLDRAFSEKHDEYFEQTGEPCGETAHVRLDPSDDLTVEEIRAFELAWVDGEADVVECDPPHPDDPEGELVIEHDGERITYEEKP